ncbi:hypothetical protein ISCGN_029932 [Ixodes scapularis]
MQSGWVGGPQRHERLLNEATATAERFPAVRRTPPLRRYCLCRRPGSPVPAGDLRRFSAPALHKKDGCGNCAFGRASARLAQLGLNAARSSERAAPRFSDPMRSPPAVAGSAGLEQHRDESWMRASRGERDNEKNGAPRGRYSGFLGDLRHTLEIIRSLANYSSDDHFSI